MIPDKNGWARFTALMVTVVASFCAALAGMTVGLAGAKPVRAAVIGVSFGAGFFLISTFLDVTSSWSWLMKEPAKAWPILSRQLRASFVILVIGLTLVGLVTGLITSKLKG
jgi:pilus assembly protein TadC